MPPNRKQAKRNELLEFVLSPQYGEYHKKFIQKEVRKVIEIIDNNDDIEAIEYEIDSDSDDETDTESKFNSDSDSDSDSDNSDTTLAIYKIFKKSGRTLQMNNPKMSMNYPTDDNLKYQDMIYQ
jgi:hypothetical protein